MLTPDEIKNLKNVTEKQRQILLTIAIYDQGWIDEKQLEDKLTKIIKTKNNAKN